MCFVSVLVQYINKLYLSFQVYGMKSESSMNTPATSDGDSTHATKIRNSRDGREDWDYFFRWTSRDAEIAEHLGLFARKKRR